MEDDRIDIQRNIDFKAFNPDVLRPIDDLSCYFSVDDELALRRYYDDNGYAVVQNLLPTALCDDLLASFEAEVRPFNGFIYRQTTARPERHFFTDSGFLLNAILNVQSVDPRHMGGFRAAGLALITHPTLQRFLATLMGEPAKLVQSMYFEGNPQTPPHQDSYYLDAEEIGRMTGIWIALEDIAQGAGRFFVYPKSHLIDMPRNGKDFDIAFHHDKYIELVHKIINENQLVLRAPVLKKGDVLFFSSTIIHGSLPTTQTTQSRRSMTGHFIPGSSRFLQFQRRIKKLDLRTVNGMEIHHPKDLSKACNKAILLIETRFPKAFRLSKKLAIKLLAN